MEYVKNQVIIKCTLERYNRIDNKIYFHRNFH